jgi:heme A synthase
MNPTENWAREKGQKENMSILVLITCAIGILVSLGVYSVMSKFALGAVVFFGCAAALTPIMILRCLYEAVYFYLSQKKD